MRWILKQEDLEYLSNLVENLKSDCIEYGREQIEDDEEFIEKHESTIEYDINAIAELINSHGVDIEENLNNIKALLNDVDTDVANKITAELNKLTELLDK